MSLTDGLISYWKMEESSGNAIDSHGSNDLTAVNAPGSIAGKVNGGRRCDLIAAKAFTHASNDDLNFDSDDDFTFSLWVYLITNNLGSVAGLVCKNNLALGGFDDYTIRLENSYGGSGRTHCTVGNGTTYAQVASNSITWPTGVWYHVLCWHDSALDKVFLQINHDTPAEASWAGGTLHSDGLFFVGALDSGGSTPQGALDGIVDEVGFWKRALTAAERDELWNDGDGLTYPFGAVAGGAGVPVNDFALSGSRSLAFTSLFNSDTGMVG